MEAAGSTSGAGCVVFVRRLPKSFEEGDLEQAATRFGLVRGVMKLKGRGAGLVQFAGLLALVATLGASKSCWLLRAVQTQVLRVPCVLRRMWR